MPLRPLFRPRRAAACGPRLLAVVALAVLDRWRSSDTRIARRLRRARRRGARSSWCGYSAIALRWRVLATALVAVVVLGTASDQYWDADGHDPVGRRLQPDRRERPDADLEPRRRLHAAASDVSASARTTSRPPKARCRRSPSASSSASACAGTPRTTASCRSARSSVFRASSLFLGRHRERLPRAAPVGPARRRCRVAGRDGARTDAGTDGVAHRVRGRRVLSVARLLGDAVHAGRAGRRPAEGDRRAVVRVARGDRATAQASSYA